MKALFICETQLQLVNCLTLINDLYENLDDVIILTFESDRKGMSDLQANLNNLPGKIKAKVIKYPSLKLNLNKVKFNNCFGVSIFDSILYTLKIYRKEIKNKYFSRIYPNLLEDAGRRISFDVIYLSNYGLFPEWIIENFLKKDGRVIAVDEGIASYLMAKFNRRGFIQNLSEILLYEPDLFVGNLPRKLKISPLSKVSLRSDRVLSWLKLLFPNSGKYKFDRLDRDCSILWVGQGFGKYDKSIERIPHVDTFNVFLKNIEGKSFIFRPHPNPGNALDDRIKEIDSAILDEGSALPFEIELLLGYRKIPSEIHTISSSSGFYLYMLFGEKFCRSRSFFLL